VGVNAQGAALLAAAGLRRSYHGRLVLELDAIEVRAGEVVAVLGPNGAGKSTLFRILLLLERPDAGQVLFRGRVARPGEHAVMRHLAGIFQRPHLFDGAVLDNVMFGLRARGRTRREARAAAEAALKQVGLGDRAHGSVHTLSGGEVQRVALARALVLEPDVLLLDEPTANLDVAVRREVRDDLERLVRARAGGALLITHDVAEAFALADRVVVLEEGRVRQIGTPVELALEPATPFIAALTGAELLLNGRVVARRDELAEVEIAPGMYVVGLAAGRLAVGTAAHVAYRPEDVVLARAGEDDGSSVRNRIAGTVGLLAPAGGFMRVRLDVQGGALVALLTRESIERLGLERGRDAEAHIKAAALRVFPAGR
jgi:molybdopterin-binding protein